MPGWLQSALGLLVLAALAWVFSERRKAVRPRVVAGGLALQLAVAGAALHLPGVAAVFRLMNDAVVALQNATEAGTAFVFGYLGGGPLPFEETQPGASFILAFRALPLILVMSALSSLLIHWRVLPLVVRGFSRVLERTLGIGGALGVGTAANVFVGMIEAPLLVRPWLERLTRAELFALMTTGMATIAGTMLVLYGSVLGPVVPDVVGHLVVASVISAPAAVMVALVMVPEDRDAMPTGGTFVPPAETRSSMDAITSGTQSGITLLLNVIAMLVVLVALVALVNQMIGWIELGGAPLTLERILGWLLAPLALLIGVPWEEASAAGSLLGTKIILNEFVAYLALAGEAGEPLSERTRLLLTYAMCGFANLGSLGIMIGGLAAMAPARRDEVVALGARSIVAGTIATSMTGAVIGILA